MGQALKKLNFFVDEDIRRDLDSLVPVGQKSRVINDALRRELLRIKREQATEKLLSLRAKRPKVSQEEIVALLQKERRRQR